MSTVEKSIEVHVPVRTAYDQWTQFETFPQFMEGVERIVQLDDTHQKWETSVGFANREFTTEIVEQVPDQVVAWRATGEARHAGRVSFSALGPDQTQVTVVMDFEPTDLVEKAGDALGVVDRRVEGDLERFKSFIESRGTETGAWRGEVHGGEATGNVGATTPPGATTSPTTASLEGGPGGLTGGLTGGSQLPPS